MKNLERLVDWLKVVTRFWKYNRRRERDKRWKEKDEKLKEPCRLIERSDEILERERERIYSIKNQLNVLEKESKFWFRSVIFGLKDNKESSYLLHYS